MRTSRRRLRGRPWIVGAAVGLGIAGACLQGARAHIVPAEKLHPVAESYRRMTFVLNLNPVGWDLVRRDARVMVDALAVVDPAEAKEYGQTIASACREGDYRPGKGKEYDSYAAMRGRDSGRRKLFAVCTLTASELVIGRLERAEKALPDRDRAQKEYNEARQLWACFEDVLAAVDRPAFQRLGERWLEMADALGNKGILGVGERGVNAEVFRAASAEVKGYLQASFDEKYQAPAGQRLAPLPVKSPTFDRDAPLPIALPPGSNINKQLPRPRQVLNMGARGVNERETALIALGDMAFDSSQIFGEPARSLGINCNTCHNKSITNPQFFIPGLSARPGGMDVSNSFFGPHANNGHLDHVDTPDLRGIRFTAPYGRNGRVASLREFVRNVIVLEFNGPEPDPMLLDGMVAYMNEFDFLPNKALNGDGSLNARASASARRGEKLFRKPFKTMGDRSCASCHIPSARFIDRKSHDIGTVKGAEPFSQDRAVDTPTLLSAKWTPPYFHDGSQPTLRAVNEWFNRRYRLGLTKAQIDDLTAYVETVGDGVEAYEDTTHTLDAELEEFSFFLSAYETLRDRKKPDLIEATFRTIAFEIRAHKWDVQDDQYLPVLDQLAGIMDRAAAAEEAGDRQAVDALVAEYRKLYEANQEQLI
jgi:cytochrome c peroxidase